MWLVWKVLIKNGNKKLQQQQNHFFLFQTISLGVNIETTPQSYFLPPYPPSQDGVWEGKGLRSI